MIIKNVKLTELVDPVRGNSLYTKEYGDRQKGDYPVYSASNTTPLTTINTYDYDGEYLTWSTNGFGGFLRVIDGKFSVNGDRGLLIPKKGVDIDIWYLKYALQPLLRESAKGRRGDRGKNEFTKVPLATIKKVTIDIPVDSEGKFDIVAQRSLIKKYRIIESLQSYVKTQISELNDTAINVPVLSESITLTIGNIFDLEKKTNTSHFTKQFVDSNKGNIPVYSASKEDQAVTYGFVRDNIPGIQYFEDILTWNIDGSVGKAFFRKGRFSLSEKVIPLILQKKWEGLIDYDFIKYSLEEKAVENGFGFSNKAGKTRIKDIEINLPKKQVSGIDMPDIDEQKRLAEKYEQAYVLKKDFVDKLQDMQELKVIAS